MSTKLETVCYYLGQILILFSSVMLIPFCYGIMHMEWIWPLLTSAGISIALGMILRARGKNHTTLGLSQGFVIVSFSWIFASLIGSLPYYFSGHVPFFIDAVFESTSGFTTTGATVITDVDAMSQAMILYRSMTHWFGGMGIIVLVLAFLKSMGMEASHLFHAEAAINSYGQVLPRIKAVAKSFCLLYIMITVLFAVSLGLAGMNAFDAVNYAMSIIATGGFTPNSAGAFLYHDNYGMQAIMTMCMLIAGGNFSLYLLSWQKGYKFLIKDPEFRVYTALVLGGGCLITISSWSGHGADSDFIPSLFMMASIQTGSGLAVLDYDEWDPLAKMLLFLAMFIGGCSGSTSGGIKVMRCILAVKAIWVHLQQLIHPGMVKVVKHNGRPIPGKEIVGTLLFFVMYLLVYFISVLLITFTGLEFKEALTVVASGLGNVGLAFGLLGPTDTWAWLDPWAKVILIADMLLGRLELFTLMVMLHPRFWSPFFQKHK